MVRVPPKARRHARGERFFHGPDGFARGKPGAVGDAKDVRVDGDHGVPEEGVEHHVGGLAPHAGQGFEEGPVVRDLAAGGLQQPAGELMEVFRLAAVEADAADVPGDAFFTQRDHGACIRRDGEEGASGFIDALVGGLGREDDRGEQLKRGGVFEFGRGVRIERGEPFEEGFDFLRRHRRGGVGGCRFSCPASLALAAQRKCRLIRSFRHLVLRFFSRSGHVREQPPRAHV